MSFSSAGESHVYTVGRVGNHMCVSTKLSRVGGSRGATIASGNSITRLLGKLPQQREESHGFRSLSLTEDYITLTRWHFNHIEKLQ